MDVASPSALASVSGSSHLHSEIHALSGFEVVIAFLKDGSISIVTRVLDQKPGFGSVVCTHSCLGLCFCLAS